MLPLELVEKTVKYGTNEEGEMAVIISSHSIIYVGRNESFAEESWDSVLSHCNHSNKFRK